MRWLVGCLLVGCGGDSSGDVATDDGEQGPPDGQCGEVGNAIVQVLGSLELENDAPAAFAAVRLEERVWDNRVVTYAEGTTNEAGAFDLTADLVTVEDCWGIGVGYYIVGTLGEATGERGVNSWLFTAVEGTGDGVATIELPIVLVGP